MSKVKELIQGLEEQIKTCSYTAISNQEARFIIDHIKAQNREIKLLRDTLYDINEAKKS